MIVYTDSDACVRVLWCIIYRKHCTCTGIGNCACVGDNELTDFSAICCWLCISVAKRKSHILHFAMLKLHVTVVWECVWHAIYNFITCGISFSRSFSFLLGWVNCCVCLLRGELRVGIFWLLSWLSLESLTWCIVALLNSFSLCLFFLVETAWHGGRTTQVGIPVCQASEQGQRCSKFCVCKQLCTV